MGEASTKMTDAQIIGVLDKNPCRLLDSGNIRTCPVRLSFPYLFQKQEPMDPGGKAKYAATLLFPFLADLEVLRDECSRVAKAKWPDAFTKKGPTLTSPFRDQGDKEKFIGYVPGAIFITASSERRVPVVDTGMVPIVDEEEVYPGAWVIATLRAFAYDVKVKKGVSFGLQSIMKLANDTKLGGGGFDEKDYGGVVGFAGLSSDTTLSF